MSRTVPLDPAALSAGAWAVLVTHLEARARDRRETRWGDDG